MFHFISYASTSGSSYTEVSYYLHLSQTHHNAICQTPPHLPYHIHQPLSWSFQHSPSGLSLPSPLAISITFLSVPRHFLPPAQDHQHIGVDLGFISEEQTSYADSHTTEPWIILALMG